MATTKITKILFRRGSDYDRAPTILDEGEPGWCTDTCRLFVGDGRIEGGFPVLNIRTPDNAPVHPFNNDFKFEAINDTTGTSQPASQQVLTLNHVGLSASIANSWTDTRYIKHSHPGEIQDVNSSLKINDGLIVGQLAQFNTRVIVDDSLTVKGNLSGGGSAKFSGDITGNNLNINASTASSSIVIGDSSLGGDLTVVGQLSANDVIVSQLTSNTPVDVPSGGTGDNGSSVTNWNTAYSWGDHSGADYITRTEAPLLAADVTEMYNTWGDHRGAGYALATDAVNTLEDARGGDNDITGSIDFHVGAGNSTSGDIIECQSRAVLRRLNTKNSLRIGDTQSQSTVVLGTGLALDNITDQSSTFDDNMVHITAPQAVKIHTFTDGNVSAANQQTMVFQNGELSVPDTISAATKNFNIKHPTKSDKRLIHGCLEGPEYGVYVRGKTSTRIIELPDYWPGLVDENSISVQLTPVGGKNCLWVSSIQDNQVMIDAESEGEVFYLIQATRKDIDELQVEKDA
jgi:hypothetical protein